MKKLTVAAVLALTMGALPAMADCPGKPKHDQNAMIDTGPAMPVQTTTASA
ncbi:hypothetical protein [Paracoccus laeviglucosivorans]|uniref:Uncharacterized protein n=1 Tax=Paracoccus laeviglucosivorans TaxID=1197861 RepID=A0A521DVI4_9RHOB|nr:hypothetical protein [Paracoccus laeviglucosivorans]SMO75655.1 hypothetical protein SAMN06265221_1107 [Paracoccus laeviglucosivorans]